MAVDPAAVTSSFLMDDWSDDEVIALAVAGATGGGIDAGNKAFAKALEGNMLDRGPIGYKVRDSAAAGADWQLGRRNKKS